MKNLSFVLVWSAQKQRRDIVILMNQLEKALEFSGDECILVVNFAKNGADVSIN